MSTIPLFSTAEGNPIVPLPDPSKPLGCQRISALPKLGQVTPASRLEIRPSPEMAPSGVGELDALTGGWPRGCLSEICGDASSGRASVLLAALAAATQRQEACALVDTSDMFDPESAAAARVDFERLLWVRCSERSNPPQRRRNTEKKNVAGDSHSVEQALRVTDLLLQSGGFGLVVIDLGGVPFRTAHRIPLASWFRYQRAVEHTPTVLLVISPAPCAQTCATVLLKLSAFSSQLSADLARTPNRTVGGHGFSHAESMPSQSGALAPDVPAHTQLLDGLSVESELLRSRLAKPVRSIRTAFDTNALRTG